MSTRGRELVATDETTIVTESLLDAIVMEDSKSDGRLPNSTSTDESNRCEVLGQADDLLDQLATSEKCPRRWRRRFTERARSKYEIMDPLLAEPANLLGVRDATMTRWMSETML